MVRVQIAGSLFGREPVKDVAVLNAMRKVPRHRFVPEQVKERAYSDRPLPIGNRQTISQPYIVGFMTEALQAKPGDTILEIGTGSGYQAAVLAEIVKKVYSIEIVPDLGTRAAKTLSALEYDNVEVRVGDGYLGWPKQAPFDGIIVTAAPDHIPQPLVEQLKPGGRLVIPVGPENATQKLLVITKQRDGTLRTRVLMLVRFVPFTGENAEKGGALNSSR
ncbi:MAG: protein-L-isoaspartate(D-aspartate) O-methyltransferase [Candidatus Hydrogenedentota bacterium]